MFALFLLRLQQNNQHRMSLHRNKSMRWSSNSVAWEKFIVQLYGLVAVFKAARIMCPVAVQWMRPTAATMSALSISPFLNSDRIIAGLIAELPEYVAAAQDVVVTTERRKRWCQHVERLPHWSAEVKQVLLAQPSTAAAERAFSLLSAAVSDQLGRALAGNLQANVMLQYNNRWCWLVYTPGCILF